jgi:hypothetical protein
MSKFGKLKEILSIGSAVAKPFVPGAAGSILEQVSGALNKEHSTDAAEAVSKLAAKVDEYNAEQDAAIVALHERLKKAGY